MSLNRSLISSLVHRTTARPRSRSTTRSARLRDCAGRGTNSLVRLAPALLECNSRTIPQPHLARLDDKALEMSPPNPAFSSFARSHVASGIEDGRKSIFTRSADHDDSLPRSTTSQLQRCTFLLVSCSALRRSSQLRRAASTGTSSKVSFMFYVYPECAAAAKNSSKDVLYGLGRGFSKSRSISTWAPLLGGLLYPVLSIVIARPCCCSRTWRRLPLSEKGENPHGKEASPSERCNLWEKEGRAVQVR